MKVKLKNLLKEFEKVDYNIIKEDKNLELLVLEVIFMNYKKPKIDNNESTLQLILSKMQSIENNFNKRFDKIESDIVEIKDRLSTLELFHEEDFKKLNKSI